MSDDWADEVAEAPPSELAPVLPELPQIMLFGIKPPCRTDVQLKLGNRRRKK